MKNLLCICLTVVLLSSCTAEDAPIPANDASVSDSHEPASLKGSWTRKADYPSQRTEAAIAFSISSKAYVGMANGETDFWEYDALVDKWTKKSDLGSTIRNGRVSFALNNKGYAGLGASFGFSTSDFYQYDPVTDRWRNVKSYPGAVGAAAGNIRSFTIANKGYVINGNHGNGSTELYEYDPGKDCWTKRASLPIPSTEGLVAFSIGNKGYAGTGFAPVGDRRYELISQFWQYDPVTDKWTRLADFGGGNRWLAVGFSIGNKGYIGTGAADRGGTPGLDAQCDFWEYNPLKDTWTKKASLPGGVRVTAVGFSIGPRGYLGLGSVQGPNFPIQKTDFWEFDPDK